MQSSLRRGWTTGACAAAGAGACAAALTTGLFPDPVTLTLPRGGTAQFALAEHHLSDGVAVAGIVKDAGDDPDVTHGALIRTSVRPTPPGTGLVFKAGEGVGTVTRPGLPIPPGQPAINPVPRAMITASLAEHGLTDAEIEIAVPGGARLAGQTLNARLGIVGGLSILGTTGIVVPYSCAAWIDTIHRGIDVARATGLTAVAAATGRTSEDAVRRLHDLPDHALIEMGDFAGATLKYLARHPVERVTIAGGLAKMAKLAQGRLDLHSKRGALDIDGLASLAGIPLEGAATGADVYEQAARQGIDLPAHVATAAWHVAARLIEGRGMTLEIALFDRAGQLRATTGFIPA